LSITMRWRFVLVTSLLVCALTLSIPSVVSTLDLPDTSDVKVLILITDGFGWNYFDVVEHFEAWGVNVSTVAYALDYNVSSCIYRPENFTIADYLHSEMTPEMISEYDCLFITSGGHWATMVGSQTVLAFISDAFELGLTIASICTGTVVVAESNGIVNGSKVISFWLSSPQMVLAGATPVWGVDSVADGVIITGGSGGGTGGEGWLEAPTSEVCAEVVREALGLSRVTGASLVPARGPIGTNFSITAMVSNLNTSLGDILSTDIHEVTAQIYGYGNRTLIDTIELTNNNHVGNYTGHFIALEEGEYVVDIEVEDTNSTLEVVKEIEIFEVGVEPTRPIDIVLVSTVLTGGVIIILLVVALKRKR